MVVVKSLSVFPRKDPKLPFNYRTISLLSNLGKTFKKLHLLKISIMLKIRSDQYGFRPNHSITIQLFNISDTIVNNSNLKLKIVATFLNLEKAFDNV